MGKNKKMTAKEIISKFYAFARNKGYKIKIVGDYAFHNGSNNKIGKIIRFVSCKDNKIKVWEQNVGYYELEKQGGRNEKAD